ncbi:MFS general substrate transporter [Venturia nashicola]|uniref:MFS general substrate transporter n=1 Tax=Venturia nashicola TaxID=86259 RepID=A0A4Z1PDU5_9PEZI|nr:MFS general substrate transporter [Venturia nashicola]
MALFFEEMGYADDMMGIFFTMTLVGDVLLSLLLTLVADGLGRRKVLFGGSALMVLSGAAFALSENYWVLLFAAVVGVISPSGSEIGPFRAVEESTLSHLTTPETRAEVLTWYIVTATVGTSGGLVFCGNLVDKLQERGRTAKEAYHTLFWIYSACGGVNMLLTLFLSSKCEADGHSQKEEKQQYQSLPQSEEPTTTPPQTHARTPSTTNPEPKSSPKSKGILSKFTHITPSSRPTLYKLCAIMSLDSLASGMAASSLISLYITRKYPILSKNALGSILSITCFISALMNIWAGAIAKRIGLVKTMVFTHLPSALFLGLLPLPSSLWATVGLLVARSCLSSMDQAPRSAFIAAVVRPEERTGVMGVVNVVKILAQSGGPSVSGLLARNGLFWVAFVLAGSLKVCYDLGLLTLFVGTRLNQYEEGQVKEVARDEEDLTGLLDDSDSDDGEQTPSITKEEGNGFGKAIEASTTSSKPRKSFTSSRSKSKGMQGSEEDIAGDLASPKGYERSNSFHMTEVG